MRHSIGKARDVVEKADQGAATLVRYNVYGWTRREPRGFAAVVAAVPTSKGHHVVRVERMARMESEAMMLLVLMADALVRKMKRHGHELASLTIDESPPKGLAR